MTAFVSHRFTGPNVRRTRKGACPGCGKQVTRSRTFEHTVNPFNCTGEGADRREKTWEEVRADVRAEADAWVPDFTCRECEDAQDIAGASVDDLIRWIGADGHERYRQRHAGKESRANLCNQRIARYAARVAELDPGRVEWPTGPHYDGHNLRYCCYFEFPDGRRCVYSARHGAGYHLSPTGDRAPTGAGDR